jgi:hypothetical protein
MLDSRSGIVYFPQRWKVYEPVLAGAHDKTEEA